MKHGKRDAKHLSEEIQLRVTVTTAASPIRFTLTVATAAMTGAQSGLDKI